MTKQLDVLSYGTIGMDVILRVPHWPRPDVSTHTSAPQEHLGGKATNVAAHLATWGLRVAVSGTVIGLDAIGLRLLERLKHFPKLQTDFLETRADVASMHCVILVNPAGERAIIGINADNHPRTTPTDSMIRSARVLTLDLYGGEERALAARMAHGAGIPVIVGDLRRADHPTLPFTSIAIASAAELRGEYPGMDLADFGQTVLRRGPSGVVITDGPDSALIIEPDGTATLRPPRVTVADTTGAGDAFRAGLVYGAVKGMSLIDCAHYGIAAGSFAVGQEGAASHPPGLDELQALADRVAG